MIKHILVFLSTISVFAFFLWFGGMQFERGPLQSFFLFLAIVLSLCASFLTWESDNLQNKD